MQICLIFETSVPKMMLSIQAR